MPNGARSSSRIFFSGACGAWSVAMISIVPSLRPPITASTSLQVRSGGFILKLESNVRSRSSVSVKWCGQASAVTLTPRRLPSRTSSTERAVEMCWMCSRPPVISARRMSRATMMSSAAAGMPPSPSRIDSKPFVHHAADGQLGHLAVLHDHAVEHLGVFEGPAHQGRRGDRGSVVGERDGAAGDELAEFGQLFALASLADGADGIDVGLPGPLGLEHDELGRGLGVDGGHRVGHAGDRRHAAGQGGGRAGGDGLVLLVARLAEVDVNVDQARADDHAPGVDDDLGLLDSPLADRQDSAPADPEVADLVEVLAGVDDPAAA